MGEITVANKASSKFPSLRTTIPMSIVRQWKLQAGDRLDWEWKVIEGQMALSSLVKFYKKFLNWYHLSD
jgi:hypothetical protein